jgi:hypothetical protein
LTLEDGTERLYRNVGSNYNPPYVKAQKSEDFTCTAAEA